MADEPENLVIRLLQDMRVEMQELRADLTNRIDGNTVILNMLAGLLHDHEQRLTSVEGRLDVFEKR